MSQTMFDLYSLILMIRYDPNPICEHKLIATLKFVRIYQEVKNISYS
jgi:hypothetical protein